MVKFSVVVTAPSDSGKEGQLGTKANQDKSTGNQVQELYWSAPPKIDFKPRSQTKLLADAQKAYQSNRDEGDNEKVHIPETFDDSDSDSDSFTIKVQQLTGIELPQDSKEDKGESSKQVWFMKEVNPAPESLPQLTTSVSPLASTVTAKDVDLPFTTEPLCQDLEQKSTLSPEIFIPDDTIINTQYSVDPELGDQNASQT